MGTNVGDIGIWEVGSRDRLANRTFKVWDISAASMPMQVWDHPSIPCFCCCVSIHQCEIEIDASGSLSKILWMLALGPYCLPNLLVD